MSTATEHDLIVALPLLMTECMLAARIRRGLEELGASGDIPDGASNYFSRRTHDCVRGHIASSLVFAIPGDIDQSFAVAPATSVHASCACEPSHFHKFDFHSTIKIVGLGDIPKRLADWLETDAR